MVRTPLILLLAASVAHCALLPKSWKRCSKSDPKMNECLKVAVLEAFQDMTNGQQSLGVLPTDPMRFSRIELDPGNNGPVAVNLTFIEADVIGLSRAIVNSLKMDWDNTDYHGTFSFKDPVQLVGDYHINGKVLLLPIVGNGKANFTLENLKADLTMKGKSEKKGSKTFVVIDKTDLKLETSHLSTHFANLFNGDKALGDNINQVINENWQELFKAFGGTISEAIGQALQQIANRVFSRVALEDIYLP